MRHNYHTHTFRCNHAFGTEREYVEAAIAAGIKTLGFSDHAPHYAARDAKRYPNWCMRPEQMADYVDTVRALAKEYEKEIRILCGVELEYTPDFHRENTAFLKGFQLDYMILGQHFLGDVTRPYHFRRTEDGELNYYISTVLSAISTGDFAYVAHPDIAGYQYSEEAVEREYRRLCEGAKRMGVPLELNLLGVRDGRDYSKPKLLEIAAEVGNEIILGIDAHSADVFGENSGERAAMELAERAGVKIIDCLL